MANVKNGGLREIIIDRCLQSRRGYSTMEIMGKCNDALEKKGELPVTATNTIRNDILSISNRWHIVVEEVRDGRNVRYRYEDPEFSIFNTPLNEDDIMQLSQSVSLLQRFEGMPGFEWVDELNAHLETAVNMNTKPIVGFDENARLKGMDFFTPLFNNIRDRRVLLIRYKPYNAPNVLESVIHPYYLKEYNQRWFLFGLDDKHRRLSTFALDRIDSIEKTSKKYIENTDTDFNSYFNDIVGVTNNRTEVEEISLWVDKEQLPYILSKPIHRSQEIVRTYEDGSGVIVIKVKQNYELTQLLLSFGDSIYVQSPAHIREGIKEKIKRSLKKYESVQLD